MFRRYDVHASKESSLIRYSNRLPMSVPKSVCGAFYNRVLLLEEEVWAHSSTLAPPSFILMPISILESERSSICVEEVSILTVTTIYNYRIRIQIIVLNATFNNISAISWRSLLLVEETGVPEENHQPVASH